MVLLKPLQYVVNLVRKISTFTFNSDNSLACFVLILPKSNSKERNMEWIFYKLEIKFSGDMMSDYLGFIILSPVSSIELQVGNHKCTFSM